MECCLETCSCSPSTVKWQVTCISKSEITIISILISLQCAGLLSKVYRRPVEHDKLSFFTFEAFQECPMLAEIRYTHGEYFFVQKCRYFKICLQSEKIYPEKFMKKLFLEWICPFERGILGKPSDLGGNDTLGNEMTPSNNFVRVVLVLVSSAPISAGQPGTHNSEDTAASSFEFGSPSALP